MDGKSKTLINNLGILTLSNFSSKILVFLLVPLYTSVLSTEEYGLYDLVVSTVSLLVPVISLNIIDAVMRFMMDKKYSQKQVASIGIIQVTVSIILVATLLFACDILHLFVEIDGFKILIFCFYVSYILNQYFIQFAKGLDKVKEMGIAGVLGTLVMIITNLLFLLVIKLGIVGFFIANIISQIIPVIYILLATHFWGYLEKSFNKELWKEMIRYSVPLIASVIGWWVNNGADKYVVTFFCGMAANGLLSVAYKIPSILNTFQSIFIQAWQISAIKEYGDKNTAEFYGKTFIVINTMICIVCGLLIAFTRPLAQILYSKDFYFAWELVPFLLISSVFNCASGFLGPILSAKKDSKSMAISSVYGAVVNILLNVCLVNIIGICGITVATALASFVIYQVRKRALDGDIVIYQYHKVLITWILLLSQAFIEVYLGFYVIEIVFFIILVFININSIKEMYNNVTVFIKKRGINK